ncbi:hypothetical protein [Candidatus Darwinibacter acetoxidans]
MKASRLIVALVTIAALGCLAERAARTFGSGMVNGIQRFTSDDAIPLLMTRSNQWNLFQFYYWGQDRFGAWPFLFARFFPAANEVTQTELQLWQSVWVVAGAVAIGMLFDRYRLLPMSLYISVICLFPFLAAHLLNLAQWAPWQVSALLLAWWGIRHYLKATDPPLSPSIRLASLMIVFVLSLLAVWSSPLCGPLISGLAVIEAIASTNTSPRARVRHAIRRAGELALPVGVAILTEAAIRYAYHRYYQFNTPIEADLPNAWNNIQVVMSKVLFFKYSFNTPLLWPLLTIIFLSGGIYSAYCLVRLLICNKKYEPWVVQGWSLIFGTWFIATAPLPLFVSASWVRKNQFADWYFVMTWLFIGFGAFFTLTFICLWLARSDRARQLIYITGTGVSIGSTVATLPPASFAPEFVDLRSTAERLSKRMPSVPILGSYWNTYVFAALQPAGRTLLPIPFEGELNRTPWLTDYIKAAGNVIVAFWDSNSAGGWGSNAVGGPQPGSRWMLQHDQVLRLIEPRWDAGAGRVFSLYRNVAAEERTYDVEGELKFTNICAPGSSLAIKFVPVEKASIVLALNNGPVSFIVEPISGDNEPQVLARLQMSQGAAGRIYYADFDGKGRRIGGMRITMSGPSATPTEMKCFATKLVVVDNGTR